MNYGVSDFSKEAIAPKMSDGLKQDRAIARKNRAIVALEHDAERYHEHVRPRDGQIKTAEWVSSPSVNAADRAIERAAAAAQAKQAVSDKAEARASARLEVREIAQFGAFRGVFKRKAW